MPVLKSEEQKMANVQGEKVVFTDQEIKTIKTGQEPGVTILGYMMARDFDNLLWYRSPCYFLYPDEERIKGSKELFTMLLQRVLILEVLALVISNIIPYVVCMFFSHCSEL
jgi:non-homologous end joining protein Ku